MKTTPFANIRSQGQLLPLDALQRILARDMPGMADSDYHLAGERQNEAINRAWHRLLGLWRDFQGLRASLAGGETGASQTREAWLLPLFQELGYGRLSAAKAAERQIAQSDGSFVTYPISHFRDESPIHFVGCNIAIDKRGAARQSPQTMMQEFLNRCEGCLWGFVSNGLSLRILRETASLSRQSFVEFNLQGIFESESFSEFALLWLCCHHSRIHSDDQPECWLETWRKSSDSAAVAALDSLRENVTACLEILGQGFITANYKLRHKLAANSLSRQDFFRQLLRLAYRLIFLLVVEERKLLHGPEASPEAIADYYDYWSLSRLRNLAGQLPGANHHDLWEGIKIIMAVLGGRRDFPELGLRPMGGFLWSEAAVPDLTGLKLRNADLLTAMRRLAFLSYNYRLRPVDWRHLGAMELGSIYESLLELRPELTGGKFRLVAGQGNERKTTGSYYTPTQLIESLLTSALDPVLEATWRSEKPELALLGLRICDPACGSGHFLLACARRIAGKLAQLQSGEMEPGPAALRHALNLVVSSCIYGVDINPMSVELCKLGLWLETHEPGKPLTFLDHHIICANSLLGTTGSAIRQGIPASAYVALGGDDKKAVAALKKANTAQLAEQDRLQFEQFETEAQAVINAVKPLVLNSGPANDLAELEERESAWVNWKSSGAWRNKKFLYDLWTAAFALPARFPATGRILPDGSPEVAARPLGISWNTLVKFVNGHALEPELVAQVNRAAEQHKFFHVEVMFPEVAAKGGFDAILGNPPWERIKLQEKEWFGANNYQAIANAPNAAVRRKLIAALAETDPLIFDKWRDALREAEAFSHYLRNSGLYPLCGMGDINLYAVFAEWMRQNLNDSGRLGCIAPSGIATDDTTKAFFQDMVETKSLVSLYDFENRKKIFPAIDSRIKFSLLSCGSGATALTDRAEYVFFAHSTEELQEPDKRFSLSPAEIALLNPNTRTCPIFRAGKDAELAKAVYRRHPVLIREGQNGKPACNPWGIKFNRMFDMSNDSHLFRASEQLRQAGFTLKGNIFVKGDEQFLPLYEAKMIHHFNHRWATYDDGPKGPQTRDVTLEELQNPEFEVMPRYWVQKRDVGQQLQNIGWGHDWLLGWRDICRSTDERTVISAVIPKSAVGDKYLLYFVEHNALSLLACLDSFCCDYICRQKFGGTSLKFYLFRQLAVIDAALFDQPAPWQPAITLSDWLKPRILELSYTCEDLRPFARDMGYAGEPFAWNEERRAKLRAELDAAFFHLYLAADATGAWQRCERETEAEYGRLLAAFPTPRDAVSYIMDSFGITKRKDEEKFGAFRTKDMILAEYDAMLEAMRGWE